MFSITGGKILGNTAMGTVAGNGGGGMYSRGKVTLSGDCVISNNVAARYGGGVYNNGQFSMSDNEHAISDNTAPKGKDIYNHGDSIDDSIHTLQSLPTPFLVLGILVLVIIFGSLFLYVKYKRQSPYPLPKL